MRICNSSPKSMLLNVAREKTPYFDRGHFSPLKRKAKWVILFFSSKILDLVSGVLDGPFWVGTSFQNSRMVGAPLPCCASWWFVSALPNAPPLPSPHPSVLVQHPPCLSLSRTIVGEDSFLDSTHCPHRLWRRLVEGFTRSFLGNFNRAPANHTTCVNDLDPSVSPSMRGWRSAFKFSS